MTPMPDTTLTSAEQLIARVQAAFDRVKLWPEDRMRPGAVEELGHGFNDLLFLRNLVPDILSLARAGLEAGKAEESMRERAATCGADTLNAWAADLYATFEGYVEAKTTGLHAGRRIDAGNADMYAKQFRERAEAVAGSAEYVATAIRALPLTGGDNA